MVDGVTHAVLKYLLVGQRVWHGAFTPDEKYLLVANGVSNDVSVIDVANQRVIKSIQVGELPWGDRVRAELRVPDVGANAPGARPTNSNPSIQNQISRRRWPG